MPAAWLAALSFTLAGLGAAGKGVLAAPHEWTPAALRSWLATRPPDVAVFAGLRLIVLGLAWYLLATFTLGVLVRVTRLGPLVRICDGMTLPLVRRLASSVAALSVAVGTLAVTDPSVASARTPTLLGTDVLPTCSPSGRAAGDTLTMTWLGAGDPVPRPTNPPPSPPSPSERVAQTWTVRPGDHLWGIAHATLAQAWGRAPSDAEVGPLWRALIGANRSLLADPDNADLIFPGQVLVLVSPPARPEQPDAAGVK
jgi:hypothetical protein